MSRIFEIRTIRPKDILSSNRVRANILNALKAVGEDATKIYFPMTVEHWEGKPPFKYTVRYAGGNINLSMFPYDNGSATINPATKKPDNNYMKWIWVNYGTKKRYAHMTPDWASKTSYPGVVGNNTSGRGKVAYVTRKIPPIVPGIKARRWDINLRKLLRPKMIRYLDEGIRKGLEPR
jgi:hypothetical protein